LPAAPGWLIPGSAAFKVPGNAVIIAPTTAAPTSIAVANQMDRWSLMCFLLFVVNLVLHFNAERKTNVGI
jgi:hypothetical protein